MPIDSQQGPVLWSAASDVRKTVMDSLSAGDMPPVCTLEPQLACQAVCVLASQVTWVRRLIQADDSDLWASKEILVQDGVMAAALACRLLSFTLAAAPGASEGTDEAAVTLQLTLYEALPTILQHDSCRPGLPEQGWMAGLMAAAGNDLLAGGQHSALAFAAMAASTSVRLHGLAFQAAQGEAKKPVVPSDLSLKKDDQVSMMQLL